MLIVPGAVASQPFTDCIQSVDNATVVVPASVEATVNGAPLEAGDEIALFTGDGTCAGFGVWEEESLSIAAAGAENYQPEGFELDEPLQFRIWDASSDQVYEAEVDYASCEEGSSLCRDDGRYEHNVLFRLAALNTTATLPVELLTFEATVDGREAVLRWQTASETNNAGFEIQHRSPDDGDDTWTGAAFVEGQGTTSETQHYEHRLQDLSFGTHRFRLKQIDRDGAFEYSNAVEADIELAEAYDLVAPYPNPFQSRTTFAITVAEAQRVDITVYNQLGQRVAKLHEGQLEPNTAHTFRLNSRQLTSGPYFIRIQGEQFNATPRAVLVR